MRSWPIVIALVLLTASLGAAWAAFQYGAAEPDIAEAPIPDGTPQDALQAAVDAWAGLLQNQRATSRARRQSQRAALRWLRSQPAGAKIDGPKVRVAADGDAAKARIRSLQQQLDGLPASRLSIRSTGVEVQAVDTTSIAAEVGSDLPDSTTAATSSAATSTVELELDLALPSPTRKDRELGHRITATLVRDRGAWAVADVEAPQRGILVFSDPHVADEGTFVLVGEATRSDRIDALAAMAPPLLTELAAEYEPLAGAARGTAFMVEDDAQLPPMLDRTADELNRHATAWTYDDGDIILLWPAFGDLRTEVQDGTLAHELVHLVTLPSTPYIPVILLEGIAMEAEIAVPGAEDQAFDTQPLVDAFEDGTVNYLGLVRTTGEQLEGNYVVAYLAGYSTVSYLRELRGDDTLVRFLASMRSGLAFDDAIRRSYNLTPNRLRSAVRAWAEDAAA